MAINRISPNTGSRHYLTSSLLLVLSTVSILQAKVLSPLGTGSGNNSPEVDCMGLCEDGYECIEDSCTKISCMKDCSEEPYAPLCATKVNTIAETFNNECELDNKKCENEDDQWLRIYDEPCVTIPPPPENLCKQHQMRHFAIPDIIYFQMCNTAKLEIKANTGELELSDVLKCYYPTCDGTEYAILQCSAHLPGWCWCSDSNGVSIEGTLKYGLQAEDHSHCNLRESCIDEFDNSSVYKDKSLFTPASGCGLCECLDGVITCFEDYVPSSMGEINSTQLKLLKDELIQLFHFQYSHNGHVLIDVRHIHQHPTLISYEKKKTALEWKFNYYDRDGNTELSPGERHLFKNDIQKFFLCSSFFDHVLELINKGDVDENIDLYEWGDFFDIAFQSEISGSTSTGKEVKRHAQSPQQLRLKKKKRFLYTWE